MKNRLNTVSTQNRQAFTLVEMLVVLLIVSVLMGVSAQVMKNSANSQGIESAIPVAESIFSQARGLARSEGVGTRVVIYSGGGNGDIRKKHLRYMGIVRQKVNENGTLNDPSDDTLEWSDRLITRGTSLPDKTFFNESLSSGFDTISDIYIPGETATQQCIYYEFNAEGILVPSTTPSADEPYGVFVVQSGRLLPTEDTPREASKDSREAGGFAIWKRGNTSLFRSVKDIPGVETGNPQF